MAGVATGARGQPQLNEQEFLGEIPIVYGASRMPQQPEDAPGATTVIDREQIRTSGARDLTELFHMVPGFVVATMSGGKSVVAYHGLSGQVSQRLQVYVDGRSVYAPYLFGGVDWSTVGVPIDEIERIEIQRGASSVAYGANAFLGVIHVITRSAAQSAGVAVAVNQGNSGIADRYVRAGYAGEGLQWRVAAGTRADDGLLNRNDSYRNEYLDARAEIQFARNQELALFAGITRNRAWVGYENSVADPLRRENSDSSFLQARYRYVVSPTQEWGLSYAHTLDNGGDRFSIPLLGASTLNIDSSRRATRDAIEYRHFAELSQAVRASWGAEYRYDAVTSGQLFNTLDRQSTNALRAYVIAEIRPSAQWTLNVGGNYEREALAGGQFAPRLSLNWKPATGQAVKLGYSSAFRTPTLFEQRANWRIVSDGQTLDIKYLSRGGLVPERVKTWDLVYLGQFPKAGLTLDARLFHESFSRLITGELYMVPPDEGTGAGAVAYDLRNNADATNLGVEYQVVWRPWSSTSLSFSQYAARPSSSNAVIQASIPERGFSLVASQTWGSGWSANLVYSYQSAFNWIGEATPAGAQRLATARVAKAFRFQGSAMQAAAMWRGPLAASDEFRELQRIPKQFWVSLSAEY